MVCFGVGPPPEAIGGPFGHGNQGQSPDRIGKRVWILGGNGQAGRSLGDRVEGVSTAIMTGRPAAK